MQDFLYQTVGMLGLVSAHKELVLSACMIGLGKATWLY
jgi:hypothetical protein